MIIHTVRKRELAETYSGTRINYSEKGNDKDEPYLLRATDAILMDI